MKVKFKPTDQVVEGNPAKTLLQLCGEHGIEIKSLCKGVPSCAECRVRLVDGEHNVIPPTSKELHVLGSNYFLDGRRLSCQVRAFGDITVDITEQLEREDNTNKKVRGFRSPRKGASERETQAKQGILILEEKK